MNRLEVLDVALRLNADARIGRYTVDVVLLNMIEVLLYMDIFYINHQLNQKIIFHTFYHLLYILI